MSKSYFWFAFRAQPTYKNKSENQVSIEDLL